MGAIERNNKKTNKYSFAKLMQLCIGLAFPVQLNQFQTNLLLRNQLEHIL